FNVPQVFPTLPPDIWRTLFPMPAVFSSTVSGLTGEPSTGRRPNRPLVAAVWRIACGKPHDGIWRANWARISRPAIEERSDDQRKKRKKPNQIARHDRGRQDGRKSVVR